ncbi:MAG: ECF transporter S component [Clostridiales bacterium]|nr:ECF transporter S component [Clostridiales bacterium]
MNNSVTEKSLSYIRYITVTAIMAAVAAVLQLLEFPLPMLIPPFIKFDFSELPALISAFALGPVSGVTVCLIKNVVKLLTSQSGGIGELSNFLIGACFVGVAGVIYKHNRTRKGALIACLAGSAAMAVLSLPINYYITYPFYSKFMPIDQIVRMYQEINPNVNGLVGCLIIFNIPFTFMKGVADSIITFAVYKYLSPVIKGRKNQKKAES